MKHNKTNSGASAFNLRSRENRVRLLKAGYTGKQIEALYIHLENLVIVPGNFQGIQDKSIPVIRDIKTNPPLEDKDSSSLSSPVIYPCLAEGVAA